MPELNLPPPIKRYFDSKGAADPEETLACFAEDATVWDNGEDLELRGIAQIRSWMTGTVAGYNLTSRLNSIEMQGSDYVVAVVVSGDFPGSPYAFTYRFTLNNEKISALVIDPVGSV